MDHIQYSVCMYAFYILPLPEIPSLSLPCLRELGTELAHIILNQGKLTSTGIHDISQPHKN